MGVVGLRVWVGLAQAEGAVLWVGGCATSTEWGWARPATASRWRVTSTQAV